MYDGIDNNGNGLIDEPDEGIDEPLEYNPLTPYWDESKSVMQLPVNVNVSTTRQIHKVSPAI